MYLCAGPFGSSVAPDSALELVSELRAQLEALKEEEQSIRYGLSIFDIEEPASKDILNLEKVPIQVTVKIFSIQYNTDTFNAKHNRAQTALLLRENHCVTANWTLLILLVKIISGSVYGDV